MAHLTLTEGYRGRVTRAAGVAQPWSGRSEGSHHASEKKGAGMGATTERRRMAFTNRLANPAMRLLFKTPARRLADRSFALLRVTGRRSGEAYTFPVQYAREDDALTILVGKHERKTWWRNLGEHAPVHVRWPAAASPVVDPRAVVLVRVQLAATA